MLLNDYFDKTDSSLKKSPIISSIKVQKDRRSHSIGIIYARIVFVDESALIFMEYLESNNEILKKTYSYHYQSKNNELIFRYDNSPHHPEIPSFPNHKHSRTSVLECNAPSLDEILKEISFYILSKNT